MALVIGQCLGAVQRFYSFLRRNKAVFSVFAVRCIFFFIDKDAKATWGDAVVASNTQRVLHVACAEDSKLRNSVAEGHVLKRFLCSSMARPDCLERTCGVPGGHSRRAQVYFQGVLHLISGGHLCRESVRALLPRLHYFESGTCIVHHLFGAEVSQLLRRAYGDAYLTAHFEVRCSCTVFV